MKLSFSAQDEQFRTEVASWLRENLCGEFEAIRGRGGPGDEHMYVQERKAWEHKLHQGGWTCIGWPAEYGGRAATIEQQVIFNEEYARAAGPGRIGHIGETLVGPTIIAFGTEEQKQRFLPGILRGEELWCQGYSEPSAGSDLANVKTRARFDDASGQWQITGQKVWTSLAHESRYCFVIARTDPDSVGHKGLGFFLVDMDQPGVDVRPIEQLTGTSEFNEVFFDDAVCGAGDIVGAPGEGWKVAMGLLGFERGVSTLGQQMLFQNEFDEIVRVAKNNGAAENPAIRQRIADAHVGLRIMRFNSMRMLSGDANDGSLQKEAMIYKLYWATWHRNLGKLAMDVLGAESEILDDGPYELNRLQSMYLFTRSDTIYGGTNQIQRNIIAERALGNAQGTTRLDKELAMALKEPPPYVKGHGLLAGKSVLITAAAGAGIGFAAATRAAEEGARAVMISDIHEGRLHKAVEALKAETGLESVYGRLANVTIEEEVQALVDEAESLMDGVDVLINNAGLGGTKLLVDMEDEEWSLVLDITLTGTMRMTRAMLKKMQPRGAGVIVNNASVLGWRAQKEQCHYAAAKAGVMALTRCAALEAADHGVRINAVSPSIAFHEFLKKTTPMELLEELASKEAFGRAAEVWEVANVMMFLASDYSGYMTGEIVSCSSQRS